MTGLKSSIGKVRSKRTAALAGHIEGVRQGNLIGWIMDPALPDVSLTPELEIDGEVRAVITASLERNDLLENGYTSSRHGFSYQLAGALFDNQEHVFRVLHAGNSIRRKLALTSLDTSAEITNVADTVRIEEGGAPELSELEFRPVHFKAEVSPWWPKSRQVLVVGSAPSIADHENHINAFDGEIWALNDAVFWLNERGITPDRFFCTDNRFIKTASEKLDSAHFDEIVILNNVDLSPLKKSVTYRVMNSLGRDGFSDKFGNVYHGCSVLLTALQCVAAIKYSKVYTVGVLLSPPGLYKRIDGSVRMPEYVHHIQMKNVKLALNSLRDRSIVCQPFESNSNLRFL